MKFLSLPKWPSPEGSLLRYLLSCPAVPRRSSWAKEGALSKGSTIREIRAIRSSSFYLTTNHTNHTNSFITTYSRISPLGSVMSVSFQSKLRFTCWGVVTLCCSLRCRRISSVVIESNFGCGFAALGFWQAFCFQSWSDQSKVALASILSWAKSKGCLWFFPGS